MELGYGLLDAKTPIERLGHSGIAITGDLHSHVQATVQQEAAERFERRVEQHGNRGKFGNGKFA